MNKIDYDFLAKLKTNKISYSSIPKSVKNAAYFENFIAAKVIILEGNINRGFIRLNENETDYFDEFIKNNFPDAISESINKAENIKTFRNSKARATASNNIIFLRGNQQVIINDIAVDLAFHTQNFGVFAVALQNLCCEKICFVENLAAFLAAEKLISEDYIFIHTYGRVGEKLLQKIQTKHVLVFSDYDFIGLDEYLKFKSYFENSQFFMPPNYDAIFDKYNRPLANKNKETTQKPSKNVQNSTDEVVVKIRTQVFKTQRFLEQEILISL
jgi:5S rRNA maturation endonuclease (ribonuclease M5)